MWSGWLKTSYCVVSALEALDKVSRGALGDSNGETVIIDFRTPAPDQQTLFNCPSDREADDEDRKYNSLLLFLVVLPSDGRCA